MTFFYLSPLILPILPEDAGITRLSMNVQRVLDDVALDRNDVNLNCRIETFQNGERIADETLAIAVRDGMPDLAYLDREFSGRGLSYAQVSITAERPIFRKLLTEHVYSVIERTDGGTYILNAAFKFSDPLIVNLMRRVGTFCLVHPAQYVNRARDIGNSALIINPFDGPVVARLSIPSGKTLRRRIAPRTAIRIGLEELIEDDHWTCVMYTGNNRYPAWDMRHTYSDARQVNRIDHLEFFRGDPTVRRLSLQKLLRSRLRKSARTLGLRN